MLTLLLYIRALGFDFVTWDDHTIIVNNPIVQDGFSSWEGVFDIGSYARFMPLAWVSFKAISATMGMDPAYFHASSVVLHVINTILLYATIRWIFLIRARRFMPGEKDSWQTLITLFLVLFWSWHPLRVEPVAWSTGLTYNVSTFFFLGSLLCLLAYQQFKRLVAALGSTFLFACSLATYPPAATWPLAIPLFYLLIESDNANWHTCVAKAFSSIRKSAVIIIPSAIISGAFLSLTLFGRFMGKSDWYGSDNSLIEASTQLGLGERLINSFYSGSGLIQRMLMPLELSPAWPPDEVRMITIFSVILILLALTGLIIRFFKTPPCISLGLIVVGITALPVIGLTEGSYYQPDRYTHILQLVIVVVLAIILPIRPLASLYQNKPALSHFLLISLALILATLNFRQQSIWTNSYTLFDHLQKVSWVSKSPERLGQVQCMRARKLTSDKRYAEAAAIYEPLLEKNPHPYNVAYFASINYMLMGNIKRALGLAEYAAQLDQRDEIMRLQNYLQELK